MAEILLFHHAQGLTEGVEAFADELRAAGHTVQTPDLYEGRTFPSLNSGVAFAQEVGFGEIIARGERAAEGFDGTLIGISLGALPAQALAHRRTARGPDLGRDPARRSSAAAGRTACRCSCTHPTRTTTSRSPATWPRRSPGAELFLYPGADHLFVDRSLAGYDEDAAALVTRRVLDFLAG